MAQLLAQVCRMTGHRMRRRMEKLGLHKGQGFVLIHLWHRDGAPQRELSRAMRISPASVTNMLQRMERDGWITRERDREDQRVVRVRLTAKAKDLHEQTQAAFHEMEEELASIYSEEERATLHRLLQKLYDHFACGCRHDAALFRKRGSAR